MKKVAISIIILDAVFMLIAVDNFDSLLFWGVGIIMLLDGIILFTLSTLYPEIFSKLSKALRTFFSHSKNLLDK